MNIDININNRNKHWILVVLSKIKVFILTVGSFVCKCLKGVSKFIKRAWKILVGIAALIIIVAAGAWAYDYYTNTWIPEKLLSEAVADIESKFDSKNDSIKLENAFNMLHTDYAWGYNDVDDYDIRERLSSRTNEAFKFIEDKAYAGNAKAQFALGQLYYHDNDCIDNDNSKAAYWWNEAAQQDYTKAYNNVGIAYKEGIGVNADLRLAIEWLKKGAEAGDDLAQRNYGDLFRDGVRIQVGSHKEQRTTTIYTDNRIKEYWDNTRAQYMYVYLEDVADYEVLIQQNIEQAKFWWKKSAAQGNKVAKERLQQIYN